MTAVFVGKGVNSAFRQTVLRILEEKTQALEISQCEVKASSEAYAVTTIFTSSLESINLPNAIVFLNHSDKIEISRERCLVCDSSCPSDLKLAKNSSGEVITCGLSLRDTVTFSSLTEENCVISIQRSITKFDGQKTEPCEIPSKISGSDDKYAVLCANLLLVLLGCI